MIWIVVGVAVVLLLLWMWRLDRRGSRGRSRLGWSSTRWTAPQPGVDQVPRGRGDNANGTIPGSN